MSMVVSAYFEAIDVVGVAFAGIPWEGGARYTKIGLFVQQGKVLCNLPGNLFFFVCCCVSKKGKENWNGKGLY